MKKIKEIIAAPVIAVVFLSISLSFAEEIDPSVFYLPEKYKHLLPLIMEAGKLTIKTEKCVKVIDGSISKSKSKLGNPVFFYNL